jgi:hypothetical protein
VSSFLLLGEELLSQLQDLRFLNGGMVINCYWPMGDR